MLDWQHTFKMRKGHFVKSIHLVATVTSLAFWVFPSTGIARPSCADISSNETRLACYDQLFPPSLDTLGPSEAFRRFTEFSQQSGPVVTKGQTSMDFRLTDCVFESSFSEINKNGRLDGWYSKLDLRSVKSMQPHRSWDNSVEISMNRGTSITGFTIWPGFKGVQFIGGDEVLTFFRKISGTNHDGIKNFEERTRGVPISLEGEDRDEAYSLFKQLVASCQD